MNIRQKYVIGKEQALAHSILMRYPFYENAANESREKLINDARILRCAAGQILYGHNGRCDEVVLVGSGEMRIYVAGESGREFTLYSVGAGEICPVNIQAACANAGLIAYATAQEALEAVIIPAARFRRWVQDYPEARQYLFESTFDRFVSLIKRIREITTSKIDHRLGEFLLWKFHESEHGRSVIKMTHEKIAIELGTAREVVSRRLQLLEKAHAIELYRGRIVLSDEALLRQALDLGNV
jgi:CRP/FNR family transcriptional regulator